MSGFPIIARELRVQARSSQSVWERLSFFLLAVPAFGAAFLFSSDFAARAPGIWLFRTATMTALGLAVIEGVRRCSDSLTSERREGTLGLLFLTDLTAADVVAGKLAGAALSSFYALLAITPLLAVPILLGGVTLAETIRVMLLVVLTFWLSATASLFCSAFARDDRRAQLAAFGLVAGLILLPPMIDQSSPWIDDWPNDFFFSVASPVFAYHLSLEAPAGGSPAAFHVSLVILLVAGAVLLFLAMRITAGAWRSDGADGMSPGAGKRPSRKIQNSNPIQWLVVHATPRTIWPWGVLAVFITTLIWAGFEEQRAVGKNVVEFMAGLCRIALYGYAAWLATFWIAESKRDGAIEFLATSGLDNKAAWRGHWLALTRRCAPLAVAYLPMALVLELAAHPGQFPGAAHVAGWMCLELAVFFSGLGLLTAWAFPLSLLARQPGRAANGSLLILLASWGFTALIIERNGSMAWPIGRCLINAHFIVAAARMAKPGFRALASRRFDEP